MTKQYLGDSVYFDYAQGMVVLTTENGFGASNTIYLEANVVEALLKQLGEVYGVSCLINVLDPE